MKELEDRAETSELQVVNNNHQYRKLIQEKDVRILYIIKCIHGRDTVHVVVMFVC